jgi:hypothetical protein
MIYTLPGVNSNEDKLRSASINKPLTDEHENSRPKIKDSWSKKLTDCLGNNLNPLLKFLLFYKIFFLKIFDRYVS